MALTKVDNGQFLTNSRNYYNLVSKMFYGRFGYGHKARNWEWFRKVILEELGYKRLIDVPETKKLSINKHIKRLIAREFARKAYEVKPALYPKFKDDVLKLYDQCVQEVT